jgi:ribose transport system ATP-binding protein
MAGHEPDVSSSPMLEIRGLRKVYGGTAALAGVDLTVERGEIHALLGENGAGKSTLVRILAAVDHEDGGSIAIAGSPSPLVECRERCPIVVSCSSTRTSAWLHR